MKKILLLFQICILVHISFTQELIVNDSLKFVKGIYRNFEEFKFNSPFIELEYETSIKKRGYGIFRLSGPKVFYRIDIDYETAKSIGKVFGFCDGESVYINENSPQLSSMVNFVKLESFGRYCYYEDVQRIISTSVSMAGGYGGGYTFSQFNYLKLTYRAVDISDGKIVKLTPAKLREIMSDDNELLDEFKKCSPKYHHMKEFLIKYNNKHKYNTKITSAEKDIIRGKDSKKILFKLYSDTSYSDYYYRIIDMLKSQSEYSNVKLEQKKYKNGNIKSEGIIVVLSGKNNSRSNSVLKVGTWQFYYNTGQIKELIDYDMNQNEIGKPKLYNKKGTLLDDRCIDDNYY